YIWELLSALSSSSRSNTRPLPRRLGSHSRAFLRRQVRHRREEDGSLGVDSVGISLQKEEWPLEKKGWHGLGS
ncbi:unnamed protein product, partial [Urochloa humidicola]